MILDTFIAPPSRQASVDPGPFSDFWYNPVGHIATSGIVVNPGNAMGVATVFSCVRFLSEMIGSLDFDIRHIADGQKGPPAKDHDFYSVLLRRPNYWQTPMEWSEMGMAHLCLRGNFYCWLAVNENLDWELIPLNPDRMEVNIASNRRLVYTYRWQDGAPKTFAPGEILHIRTLTLDGVKGMSVVECAKNDIGLELAEETHGASLFKNGGLPAFWIGRPQGSKFTPEARRNFRAGWRRLHGGAENAGNPPILEDGMELHQLGLTNKDTQWLESRQHQAIEICRAFRVPPQLIYAGNSTAKDLEALADEVKRFTLFPWCKRWVQAMNRDLLDNDPEYTSHVNLDELSLVSMLPRYQANNYALQGGWKTRNEVRGEEGLEPIEGGDELLQPLNMQPAGGGPDVNEQGGAPGDGTRRRGQDNRAKETEPEPEEQAKPQPDRKRLQEAFRPLLADVARRVARAEIDGLKPRAAKAESDREKWKCFAGGFYSKHGLYTESLLAPIVEAWNGLADADVNKDELMKRLGAIITPVFDATRQVVDVLTHWESTRDAEIMSLLESVFFTEERLNDGSSDHHPASPAVAA